MHMHLLAIYTIKSSYRVSNKYAFIQHDDIIA